jgi:transposase InsO family protein
MRQSMSRADECTDNAFMESCFGTIKTELEMTEYDHPAHARAEVEPHLSPTTTSNAATAPSDTSAPSPSKPSTTPRINE